MPQLKEYFRDRMVLLLLTVNGFLAALGAILILLRLAPGRNEGYFIQFRPGPGVNNTYRYGHASDILAFIGFMAITLLVNVILSMRVFHIHRQFAITILGMGVLLVVLAIIVSNALLVFG